MRRLCICACALLAAGTAAYGEPLTASSLPQNTRWVIHVDVDGARQAKPLWELARLKIIAPQSAAIMPKLGMLERVAGMKLPDDLRAITLYGASFAQSDVCVRIHGAMKQDNILAILRLDPEFKQTTYNGHDILQWRDKTRNSLTYAGLVKDAQAAGTLQMIVLSENAKVVNGALDALDGKTTLKADSLLSPQHVGANAGTRTPIFWMAADNLSDLSRLPDVESPVFSQIDAASLAVGWSNDRALAELRIQTRNDKTALQLQAVAEGVKALVALSAGEEHAPANLRLLSDALQQINLQVQGSTLKGDWAVPIDKIETLANLAAQEIAAGMTAPATTTAPAPTTKKMP